MSIERIDKYIKIYTNQVQDEQSSFKIDRMSRCKTTICYEQKKIRYVNN